MSVLIIFSFLACQNSATVDNIESSHEENLSFTLAYNVGMDLEDDDYDIFTMNPDGSGKKNIVENPDVAWTYLAGKNRVFFISDRDTCTRCYFLYEMDVNGNNVRKITDFRLKDSWMDTRLEETEMIVNPHSSIDSVFYIIDLQGNVLHKIGPGMPYFSDPCFSPDGKQIAFRGGMARSKREEGFNEALYIMNVGGSGLLKLTNYPPTDTTAPWYAYKAGPPRWNTAENFISYQSFRNNKYSLYAVTPDGSKHWKLTENLQEEGWHDWSPDGKWLAIELFNPEQTQFHIGLMNWKTKDLKILTDTSYVYQQAPVFIVKS